MLDYKKLVIEVVVFIIAYLAFNFGLNYLFGYPLFDFRPLIIGLIGALVGYIVVTVIKGKDSK